MESIYTKLALYWSKKECAKTDNVFSPISEVCNVTVSLLMEIFKATKFFFYKHIFIFSKGNKILMRLAPILMQTIVAPHLFLFWQIFFFLMLTKDYGIVLRISSLT